MVTTGCSDNAVRDRVGRERHYFIHRAASFERTGDLKILELQPNLVINGITKRRKSHGWCSTYMASDSGISLLNILQRNHAFPLILKPLLFKSLPIQDFALLHRSARREVALQHCKPIAASRDWSHRSIRFIKIGSRD